MRTPSKSSGLEDQALSKYRALFGGTFDPPHLGHHEILKTLVQDTFLDTVHLVPARLNPFKNDGPLGSVADRLRWIELWCRDLQQQLSASEYAKLVVERFEIDQKSPEPSYTIDTLEHLLARESAHVSGESAHWILVGGADLVKGLPQWKRVSELLAKIHSFWIFPRQGLSATEALQTLPLELKQLCPFRVMDGQIPHCTSTEIRELLKASNASQDVSRLGVLPSVARDLVQSKSTL